MNFDVTACRAQFPALARRVGDRPAVFFDGPAGSQCPQRVIDAISNYLAHTNANHGGHFATSHESDVILDRAHAAVADLVGASDPDEIAFGANMTSLCFALSRALARTWKPGDEVIVTRLDHDANVTPWVLAARDAGATVQHVDIREDCTLDLDDFRRKLSPRTKLVAVGCASNAVGTVNPVAEMAKMAHAVGALVSLDAVHFAPHALVDVAAWDCDFLLCSAYKFFGPHVGVMWGRRKLLESLQPYKLRPAPDSLPGRWMTGTQNHEGIAGVAEAVEYLADLGRPHTADSIDRDANSDDSDSGNSISGDSDNSDSGTASRSSRRQALRSAYELIGAVERPLMAQLLDGLSKLAGVRIYGITDPAKFGERLPTVSFTHRKMPAADVAKFLAARGIFVWHGNYYALPLTERLGLEPEGMVRVGLLHYNTAEEVEWLLAALAEMDR